MSDKNAQQIEIEAAVYRHLVKHLQEKTEVQNIDMMNLADFCRNCLAKWYVEEAKKQGVETDYEAAREKVYGMPYSEWKERYQKPLTEEQQQALQARSKS